MISLQKYTNKPFSMSMNVISGFHVGFTEKMCVTIFSDMLLQQCLRLLF